MSFGTFLEPFDYIQTVNRIVNFRVIVIVLGWLLQNFIHVFNNVQITIIATGNAGYEYMHIVRTKPVFKVPFQLSTQNKPKCSTGTCKNVTMGLKLQPSCKSSFILPLVEEIALCEEVWTNFLCHETLTLSKNSLGDIAAMDNSKRCTKLRQTGVGGDNPAKGLPNKEVRYSVTD